MRRVWFSGGGDHITEVVLLGIGATSIWFCPCLYINDTVVSVSSQYDRKMWMG